MITYQDVLNLLAFIFTILIVLYAITKGLDTLELVINVMYFTVLFLSQIENLKNIIIKN